MTASILKMLNPGGARKSVDGVLSAFNTAITDLDAVREQSLEEAHRQEQDAIVAQANARAARIEAARAAEVSDKLKSLIAA